MTFIWAFVIIFAICLLTYTAVALFVPGLLGNAYSPIAGSNRINGNSNSGDRNNSSTVVTNKPRRKSDFPQYIGKDGKEVLVDMNAKYPEYRVEVVPEDPGISLTDDFDENRVRMFVTKAGIVTGMYIG